MSCLSAAPVETLFQGGHLSQVYGLRLEDGREVVVKVRPSAPRLVGCYEVQMQLWRGGFPCPEPLAPPRDFNYGQMASVEALVQGGEQLSPGPDSAQLFAESLFGLVKLASAPTEVASLNPTPPWASGDHRLPDLWPPPDDSSVNLNDHPGPSWLDEAASRVHTRLLLHEGHAVIGHVDWESQNIRWQNRQLYVVHDWDSVAALPEETIAGIASSVFAATGARGSSSSIEEAEAFLGHYQKARGSTFTPAGLEAAWAAGTWVRVFNAKKSVVRSIDTESVRLLRSEIHERLRRAGA